MNKILFLYDNIIKEMAFKEDTKYTSQRFIL